MLAVIKSGFKKGFGGLGFRVWDLGLRILGLGFGVIGIQVPSISQLVWVLRAIDTDERYDAPIHHVCVEFAAYGAVVATLHSVHSPCGRVDQLDDRVIKLLWLVIYLWLGCMRAWVCMQA